MIRTALRSNFEKASRLMQYEEGLYANTGMAFGMLAALPYATGASDGLYKSALIATGLIVMARRLPIFLLKSRTRADEFARLYTEQHKIGPVSIRDFEVIESMAKQVQPAKSDVINAYGQVGVGAVSGAAATTAALAAQKLILG